MTASSINFSQTRLKNLYVVVCFCQWEAKVQQGERDFEQISKTIRKEVGRFEASIVISHFS